MGVSFEDVAAVEALHRGVVPPTANDATVDPALVSHPTKNRNRVRNHFGKRIRNRFRNLVVNLMMNLVINLLGMP